MLFTHLMATKMTEIHFLQELIVLQRKAMLAPSTSESGARLHTADGIVCAARAYGLGETACSFFRQQLQNCKRKLKGLFL